MDNSNESSSSSSMLNGYHTNLETMINSLITSVDSLESMRSSTGKSQRIFSPLKYVNNRLATNSLSSTLITFDRDPATTEITEHLTDELRWLLIQYGPHQPKDNEEQFLASAISTSNGKGNVRFRSKWFDDPRFSDWLEYSLRTGRAYCFYCRLFAESNRNRAFSRDGIKNWKKCMGSRGQKKRRSTTNSLKSDEDLVICQRRGLLESHGMSESHKQAYQKYLTFVDRMHHFDNQSILNDQARK